MNTFTSNKERQLWILVGVVLMAIALTLFLSGRIINFLGNQDIQAMIFVFGMILTAMALIFNAFRSKASVRQLAVWIGIAAVYVMLFLRLGLAERSHLMEYSILAMLIHQALLERRQNGKKVFNPAVLTFVMAFGVGLLDELIQLFIPHRVFDLYDIVFNGIAVLAAILSLTIIQWIRKRAH